MTYSTACQATISCLVDLAPDTLNGGAGSRDAADYQSATEGVGVNLQTGGFAGEADGDSYSGIEYVYGSDFDDNITGDNGRQPIGR